MSTWQQTQTPYGTGSAPPPPGFYPQAAPYPKADGGYVPSGGYAPSGGYGGYPPQYGEAYGTPNVPQNNSYNAPDNFGFSDKTIRRHFISKVYSILMCQLLITLVFVAFSTLHEPTKTYVKTHPGLSLIAIVITFGTLIALACCEDLRRKTPTNFILLFVFTVAESFLVAVSVTRFYPQEVLLALGITTLLCFALTVFALQTKIDFTVMGGFLMVAAIILLIVSLVAMFWPSKLMTTIIASAGALIFSVYLIYDTQLMVGGDHKYSLSPEEYIFAALNIYVDIINIFLYILTIIGASSDD
ncbi:protein lifeguard 1-like [Adelges cooleyi]|uniref:protein lifeguard 1-like n=1 Tax=Adelges cooleyi TaxID=133065 RepID=UPI00217F8DA5|nr:protein lifeguard 1-like [Adelges cooleyi]XP_050432746.1 protein lifeguard 1-like [Adelges cooleyi]